MKPTVDHPLNGCASPRGVYLRGLAFSCGWAMAVAVLLIVASTLLHGKVGLEKMLTSLCFPVQAGWLMLSGWVLHSCLTTGRVSTSTGNPGISTGNEGSNRWYAVASWSLFTVCGSPIVSDSCYRYLEAREALFDPRADAPLDWLVVLGGGTSQGPARPEAADAGDRVLMAAQLFAQQRARRLFTTGSDLKNESESQASPARQTIEIWTELGIPETAIDTLPGINTSAELQSLRRKLDEHRAAQADSDYQPPRIGLLTSAWHLPRAMRLARAAGLSDIVPVAADHESRLEPRFLWEYVPSANGLLRWERCQKEFMAGLVSR